MTRSTPPFLQTIGVHRDDHMIAVNGVPISHLSLSDWIKAFSEQPDTTVAAAARVASSLSHPEGTSMYVADGKTEKLPMP